MPKPPYGAVYCCMAVLTMAQPLHGGYIMAWLTIWAKKHKVLSVPWTQEAINHCHTHFHLLLINRDLNGNEIWDVMAIRNKTKLPA